ncbi:BadM/Rrf2 family transcriptional regulator [Sphingomonas antarctica]|uniref:RrF2 family transcriptional regulator n=1 Tax=Sphingomonas antarctica TaxID=2040274 RepID=UPI0039EC68AB
MRLSFQTDYALRTLMYLAAKDGHHSISAIAGAYRISKNHLMKVAQRLVAEGFIESVRGRSGGLKLARPASALNVGKVVRTMEDTTTFVECFNPVTNTCVVTPACGLRHTLAGAVEAFAQHLDQFTVADLMPDLEQYQHRLQIGALKSPGFDIGSTDSRAAAPPTDPTPLFGKDNS